MTAWYYSDTQRNRHGPVAATDLAELHNSGQLQPGTLVWREGLPGWAPWREVMGEVLGARPVAAPAAARATAPALALATAGGDDDDVRPTFAAPPERPAPATAASGYNPYEVVERVPVSPYAAPTAPLGADAWAGFAGDVVYAGFWKRVAAYFIDLFIIIAASAVVGGVLGVVGAIGGARGTGLNSLIQVLTSIGGIIYFVAFNSSGLQATPGKLAIGIKVARSDGQRIGVGRAVGRYFATILSSLILMIGYVMAGFTDRKQALHDMVCDTVVVDKWAFTAHPERQRQELGAVTIVVIVLGVGLVVLGTIAFAGLVAALANASR